MNGFLTKLDIRKDGNQKYLLLNKLVYVNKKYAITVNAGFDFDGASIPRLLWGFVGSPMTGDYTTAACLHDALYASCLLPRKECDELFLEAMESEGVSLFLRRILYRAVRAGGKWAYEDNDDMDKYRKLIHIGVNHAIMDS